MVRHFALKPARQLADSRSIKRRLQSVNIDAVALPDAHGGVPSHALPSGPLGGQLIDTMVEASFSGPFALLGR